jgi:hypothetical protein
VFEPLGPYVTVRLLPDDPISATIIVTEAQGLTRKATVLAVGPKVPDLFPGDIVLCRPLTGTEVGDAILLPQSAILATVEP